MHSPPALPAPPITGSLRSPKRLSPERLYAANLRLVGLCLARFPFLTGEGKEDAYGAGMLGLWKAAQGFDPGRGFTFSTYATDTIRGYILHHLKAEKQQRRLACIPLETPLGSGDSGGSLADLIEDVQAERPGQRALDAAGFEAWLLKLPARQQDVLRGVYRDELGLTEIGAAWGMTKQRAGQIHLAALTSLRANLRREALRNRPKTSHLRQ